MTIWKWKAVDEKGHIHNGTLEESFDSTLVSYLRNQNLYPIKIKRSIIGTIISNINSNNSKLYWAKTSHKISILLEAGIPLLSVLDIIIENESDDFKKKQWKSVSRSIKQGNDLSNSLKGFSFKPGYFFESMLKAGEKSGTLAECFLEVAKQLDEEHTFEQKIKTALYYPVILLVISLIVIYTLSIVIIPMYEKLFLSLNADLPYITEIMMHLGSIIPYFFIITGFLLGASYFRQRRHSWIIPGTKKIIRLRNLMQFCLMAQKLLNAGLTIRESLNILESISKDKDLCLLIAQLKIGVEGGRRLSDVVTKNKFFRLEAAKMLEIGEESGDLSEMFGHMSKMFRRELEEKLLKYSRTLEPVLVLGMAALVGLVAVAVLMPIFDVSTHIR